MKTLNQTYEIKAPVEKVWQALTDPKIIEKQSGSHAEMDDKVGTKFKLWDGDIFGVNKKMVENEKIVQEWSSGKWDPVSKLTITLDGKNGQTLVSLLHKFVPDEKADDISDGWNRYYFGKIKKLLE